MKANHLKYLAYLSPFVIWPLLNAFAETTTIGISDLNLGKIPISTARLPLPDTDKDGLDDELEKSIGTNYRQADTDGDGYTDKTEIDNNYDPLRKGSRLNLNSELAKKLAGSYLLRVERHGELWYVNPQDKKRSLVNTSERQRLVTKNFSTNNPTASSSNVFLNAAMAIRENDKEKLVSLAEPAYKKRLEYTMDILTNEEKAMWANMLSSTKLKKQTEKVQLYVSEIYFNPTESKLANDHRATKQADGRWLISQF